MKRERKVRVETRWWGGASGSGSEGLGGGVEEFVAVGRRRV